MKYKPNTFIVVPSKYLLLKVDAAAQSVFMWLCSHADGDTGECFPSINTLAKLAKVSRNTVKDRLRKLEQSGLITKTIRKTGDGKNLPHLYQIIIDDRVPKRARSTNASYRSFAQWTIEHELATN